jgi:hypothetical protein
MAKGLVDYRKRKWVGAGYCRGGAGVSKKRKVVYVRYRRSVPRKSADLIVQLANSGEVPVRSPPPIFYFLSIPALTNLFRLQQGTKLPDVLGAFNIKQAVDQFRHCRSAENRRH